MAPTLKKAQEKQGQVRLNATQQKLVVGSLRLVHSIVNRVRRGMPSCILYDDLYSAGCLGLCEAAGRFDPDLGSSFGTFAFRRIEGAVIDCVRRQLGGTSAPASLTSYAEDGGCEAGGDGGAGAEAIEVAVAMDEARSLLRELPEAQQQLLGTLHADRGDGATLRAARSSGIRSKSWAVERRARALHRLRLRVTRPVLTRKD